MQDIKEIEEFNISKASNGYVIKVRYEPIAIDNSTWSPTQSKTLVAKDITELTSFIESWFSRVHE